MTGLGEAFPRRSSHRAMHHRHLLHERQLAYQFSFSVRLGKLAQVLELAAGGPAAHSTRVCNRRHFCHTVPQVFTSPGELGSLENLHDRLAPSFRSRLLPPVRSRQPSQKGIVEIAGAPGEYHSGIGGREQM